MASIIKIGDSWRAQIRKKGFPAETRTFETKAKAKLWADKIEADMMARKYQDPRILADKTLGDLIDKYNKEIGKNKSWGRSKTATIEQIKVGLGSVPLPELTTDRVMKYCNQMLKRNTSGVTIAIHLTYLKTILTVAKSVWIYPVDVNVPTEARTRLKFAGINFKSAERTRRPTKEEITKLCDFFKAKKRQKLPMHEIIPFAIATAMRLEEIMQIRWEDVNRKDKTVIIRDRKHPTLKTGNHQEVPLLGEAWDIVERQPKTDERIFPYKGDTVSTVFPRACQELDIKDLRFHDLRHEGVSRLFEAGYSIEQVALVSGHRDWKMLARYTQIKAKDLHRTIAG